ncbi:interleukin-23 subunit alpha [Elgaria multicarinata webbii]|uniref:interleukin-23 subunit alpha n=1 Tax=Elgaria multicarinata webbii TaxID=159646 RepID=UPI002FCCC834
MKSNLRKPLGSDLLGLLLLLVLVAASRGVPMRRERATPWEQWKRASTEILDELWKFSTERIVIKDHRVPFPQRIECQDNCDPDSLAKNDTRCLIKIHEGLQRYRDILVHYTNASLTAELQNALNKSLLLLPKDGGNTETISPNPVPLWMKKKLQELILWRLQRFASLAARVASHCAALRGNP